LPWTGFVQSSLEHVAPACGLSGSSGLITSSDHLTHHKGAAFQKFLTHARNQDRSVVRIAGKPVQTSGAILVWGAVTPEGRTAVMADFRFVDVLSVESMISDLQSWQAPGWREPSVSTLGELSMFFDNTDRLFV
jgi:hypothetical protein